MRIQPSARWYKRAHSAFVANRDAKRHCYPGYDFLLGLYRQGYSASQAGKLIAFLVRCEEAGDKLAPFDWFNVGYLDCTPYTSAK